MIAGLETISSGKLSIGDRVVNDVEPKDRDIAMVFQNYALYPHMTVFDNIGFALKLIGKIRRCIRNWPHGFEQLVDGTIGREPSFVASVITCDRLP
jgi:ABC-type sugar transport system ATPase subunit